MLTLCPFGLINDPFPGQCARFIDSNKNNICDYSQGTATTLIGNNYHLFPILFILSLLYGASILLVNKKLLTLATHRKIWNLLLLITFLISAILGILLILKINYGWQILPSNSLFWHVETGIVMTTVSIFHILWHWSYFKNLLKTRESVNRKVCEP